MRSGKFDKVKRKQIKEQVWWNKYSKSIKCLLAYFQDPVSQVYEQLVEYTKHLN